MASSKTHLQSIMASCKQVELNAESRPLAHFEPSLWGDRFTTYTRDDELWEKYSKENNSLKDEVRSMLVAATETAVEKLNLINTIERLGVSYHFEEEIEQQLEEMFKSHALLESYGEYDLFNTSLFFRIFRQHGFNISSEVFNKFKDSCNKFDEAIIKDTEGMLSFYEAAYLRTRKDHILDEAVTFTTCHLKASSLDDDSGLSRRVKHALEQPLHRGIPRLEAWNYISFYEEDPSKNDLLLKFAKLDFNIVQMLHKQELCQLMRWWRDLGIAEKLPFLRNRVVETYFWAMTIYFEPCFSLGRIIYTKITTMVSLTDDMCDAYGTMDEIELYTDAMERLDVNCIDGLPDYMKLCYAVLLDVYDEFDEEMTKLGRPYCVPYVKETFRRTMRCYNTEARWREEKYVPSFKEYCDVAFPSAAIEPLTMSSFIAMEGITPNILDWALDYPRCLDAANLIGRLLNDVSGYEENGKREHVATAVVCYTKEYGVSIEEAIAALSNQIEDAWKDLNEDCLRPTQVPLLFLKHGYLNLVRICDAIYKHGDGYTHPEDVTQFQIKAIIIDPIPV